MRIRRFNVSVETVDAGDESRGGGRKSGHCNNLSASKARCRRLKPH